MSGADDDPADQGDAGADHSLTVELLADLQAGLLDDDAAARVRRRVRADPDAAAALRALSRARADVAALGADSTSTPAPPPAVVARIAAALRSEGDRATHSARPPIRAARTLAAAAGLCALVAGVWLGTSALVRAPGPTPRAPATAQHLTAAGPASVIPLSEPQILDLLDRGPEYGPLSDPLRRASCLGGLGYPASTPVLGARPIEINGRPGVLLVLAGDTPRRLAVLAVAPNCSVADTGLLASTLVTRP